MKKLLLGVIGAIVSLTIGVLVLTHGNPLNWKSGLWRLFGFEPMTTYHSFVINSPDGTVKSKVTEWMDPDNDVIVHVRIEHLTGDHEKKQIEMSVPEYKDLWERMKDNVEPGSDKEDYR